MRWLLLTLSIACQDRPLPLVNDKEQVSGTGDSSAKVCGQGQVSVTCPVIEPRKSIEPTEPTEPTETTNVDEDDTETKTIEPTEASYHFSNLKLTIKPYPHLGKGKLKFTFTALHDIKKKTIGSKRTYTLRIEFPDPNPTLNKINLTLVYGKNFFNQTGVYKTDNTTFNHYIGNLLSMAKGESFDLTFDIDTDADFDLKIHLDRGPFAQDDKGKLPRIKKQ